MVLTALPLEDSEFVAWYTSLSDLRKDKRYSEANPLRVDMKGTQKYFYAYFKNPNVTTTSSISVTVPTNITIPSRTTTTDSDASSQTTTLTTFTTANQITADSKIVEGTYSIANEFSKSLSKANKTTTTRLQQLPRQLQRQKIKTSRKKPKLNLLKARKTDLKLLGKRFPA